MKWRVLDLFSGIGGFSLGLGAGQTEQAPFPDANGSGLPDGRSAGQPESASETKRGMAFAESERRSRAWWAVEPDVGRVAHGVPYRVDRLTCLGNAVVPQIPEILGAAILEAEKELRIAI